MRQFLILCLSAICFNVSNAQATFGIKAGLNLANLKTSGDGFNVSYDSKAGLNAGVFATFATKSSFHIQPELLYSMEGAKSSGSELKLDYLNIPVMVGYNVSSLVLETGPQIGFLLSAKSGDVDVKDQLESTAFSWGIGAGYKIPGGGFGVGARYNFGLSNLDKTTGTSNEKTRSNVLQLDLSYSFGR